MVCFALKICVMNYLLLSNNFNRSSGRDAVDVFLLIMVIFCMQPGFFLLYHRIRWLLLQDNDISPLLSIFFSRLALHYLMMETSYLVM